MHGLPEFTEEGEQSTTVPLFCHCRSSSLETLPFIAVCPSSCLRQCLLLRSACRSGLERVVATNVVGPHYLTTSLLEPLEEGGKKRFIYYCLCLCFHLL